MFIAELFTIAKTWKQPKCLSADEHTDTHTQTHTDTHTHTHTQNRILPSHKKKNEIMPFAATWVNLEVIILSELSQKEKDKYHMISLVCEI